MFLDHFGLRANPFEVSADPRYLYLGQGHREALSAVYLSIVEGGGVSVLLAEPGLGKTTLLRYLMARLEGRAAAAFFPHPYRDPRDLMRDVMSKVGMPEIAGGEFEQMRGLQQRLTELKDRGYRLVLLFDETQSLSSEALEQIRLLSNLKSTNQNLLEIVLAGQTEFAEMLEAPQRVALRQRIHAFARVEPFDVQEVATYITHRVRTAGGDKDLFDGSALARIADVSGGIPRSINQLCQKALALAWGEELTRVDENSVREAARELAMSGLRRKAAATEVAAASGGLRGPIEIRESLR